MSPVPFIPPGEERQRKVRGKIPCVRKQCDGRGLNSGPPDPKLEPHTHAHCVNASVAFLSLEITLFFLLTGYDVFSRVKTCFAGNVVLHVGDNMSCLLGGSKDIEHIYLEIGCDTAHKATFQINFNDRADSVR